MSIFFIEDKNGNYFSADGKRRFIRLKGKAAYDYLKSPNGRGKRFYRLSAEEETEEDVFIEIPSSKIGHIRKAERRTQYVADCKKESGRYEISLYALEANDHGERCSGEELIEDTAIDIESTAIGEYYHFAATILLTSINNYGGLMRINDNKTVSESERCSVQDNREYQINKVVYNVNRLFDGEKTIKEILSQKLTTEYSPSHNC